MDFVAIDVETANSDVSSICQIGLAKFSNGVLMDEWSSLINPDAYFSEMNICVHGIQKNDVISAPFFDEVYDHILSFIGDSICVSHTRYDQASLSKSFRRYGLEDFIKIWVDSSLIARRTWFQFSKKGYGLKNLAQHIGYNFKHHNALEDAKACGFILNGAIKESGKSLEQWLRNSNTPQSASNKIKYEVDEDGALFGEGIVFTGSLSISRNEAKIMAANLGCIVGSTVTKKTTLLVVGDQDIDRLAGKSKSSKHLKAEELISKGQYIRILSESDFKEMVEQFSN